MEKNETNQGYCPRKEAVRAVFGSDTDPSKSAAITTKYAAELIARVIYPDLENDSIKFDIGTKLKQQLVEFTGVREKTLGSDFQRAWWSDFQRILEMQGRNALAPAEALVRA